jgi:hypothetical protein
MSEPAGFAMKRRTFFGRVTGGITGFLLGRKITTGETLESRKPDLDQQITVRTNPLSVPRSTEKPESHG